MKTKATTESELRAEAVQTPSTLEELNEYIESLLSVNHDYGTCVYAMSMSAVAAYNFVASKLGVSGFQASCADLDIIRRNRHMEGPFMLSDGEHALYPQYDLVGDLQKSIESWKPWLAELAAKKLIEHPSAHADVVDHWKKLAAHKEAI